jgi:hypothetical protein
VPRPSLTAQCDAAIDRDRPKPRNIVDIARQRADDSRMRPRLIKQGVKA